MTQARLKKYNCTIELIVRDPAAVIEIAKSYMSGEGDWDEYLRDCYPDNDELFAAMGLLFTSNHVISADIGEAVEFYAGSAERDGDVQADWHKLPAWYRMAKRKS